MTDLLKDLEAVALLAEKATPGEWPKPEFPENSPNEAFIRLGAGYLEFGGSMGQRERNAEFVSAAVNFIRTHHAEIAEAVKLAKWYRGLRDADPDNGEPYIARERQDSWGNWKTEWLGGLDADRAIATNHNSAREDGSHD